ncbi:hypothetical protein Poli38472_011750 [Pythium oligandrum]|uniref:Transmembrane protein n=1 Tax=Pythium oligandrum TaxID=41045 RepID=A0A8K1C7U3_PYTOL|nr:hypothetical protein Poli38472_011750 [Pythium oligandrum]|eukprot:TMW58162.1 hypothetical protein Poli38472_011750 [Pythium oligandrum]
MTTRNRFEMQQIVMSRVSIRAVTGSAFTSLTSITQSAFTFVLPFIKLGLRNHFSRVLRGVDDVKSVFVVLDVDLFSALNVTSCLQSSHLWINTLLIMVIDVLQLVISLNDVRNVMKEIRSMVQLDKYKGSLLDLSDQRVHLVQKIMKLLYIVEFVLLIELAEVMIPIIYSIYLMAMTYLPNKSYYHQLASLDEYHLNHSITKVMLNATLEFLSFLAMGWLLQRELRISTMHLLAFALDTERVLIQASLLSWILYVNHQSLAHNERGRNGNAIYWIRMHLFIFIMVSGRIKQFHCCVPRLDLRAHQVVAVAFATATSATLFVYVLSSAVGFPVPFAVICASLMGLPTAIFSMFMVLRKMIHTDPELKSDLDSHFLVFIGETMMTYIYPMYLSAFKSLSPSSQSAFTLLLPLIKVTLRNHFGRVLRGVDDVKPVFVVFNVDLFSALYVTSCLQSSQSSFNIVLISTVDIIQLTVSVADVRSVLKEIHAIIRRDQYEGSILSLCSAVASNPKVRKELDRQCLSAKIANASRYNVSTAPTRQIVPVSCAGEASSLQKAKKTSLPAGIRSAQRVRLVQKITKVLYIAEFVLLIEFAEVMIPIIYSMYLVAMTYLPNKAYYRQLASLDEYHLNHSIANVMLNATLELLSFLLICWLLQRQLRISTMHLLAFALDTERVLIQASLLSWILYVNQQSLTHNAATTQGKDSNAIYWIRMHLFIFIMICGRIKQFHCCVPRLDLRVYQVILVAFATATSATLFVYVLSSAVGFPVPFAVICASLMGLPTAIVSMFLVLRKTLRVDPKLKSDLDSHFLVFIGETMMTYIYPMYLSAFKSLTSIAQSAFTFVLPFIKLGLRNHFSRVLQGVDDVKPVFVVFNVDLFSALYVTNCLQSSQSWTNTLLIMVVDLVQIVISLKDVQRLHKEIKTLARVDRFDGSLLDLCTMVAALPDVRNEVEQRCSSIKVSPPGKYSVSSKSSRQIAAVSQVATSPSVATVQEATLAIGLQPAQRAQLVQKITKLLYTVEFVLLIEFAEVMIPIIYSMYLVVMTYLPNKSYYSQLADLDAYHLRESIAHVMLNASLEFLSFLLICWLLQRELRLPVLHLLAFALEEQRVLIQASLLSWSLYVNQQSLTHNGVDFSFRFEWLHAKTP